MCKRASETIVIMIITCDVSRDSMQRRSRLCCDKRGYKKVSQIPRYHMWRWFRAGGHRNVWCMGQTSHWSDQGDRSSNRRHHVWKSSDFIPSTAPINRRSARKRDLRSWDTVQRARCRRVGPYHTNVPSAHTSGRWNLNPNLLSLIHMSLII